jgi:hypothetical protein
MTSVFEGLLLKTTMIFDLHLRKRVRCWKFAGRTRQNRHAYTTLLSFLIERDLPLAC